MGFFRATNRYRGPKGINLLNIVVIFMKSAKLATEGLLKIKVF